MTTFVKLTSPTTQGAAPFHFGIAFKQGDIPASFVMDTANYQVTVKRRWNDGSVKHAIVSGRAELTANVQATLTASPGTPPTGTNLTHASIVAAAPTASVQCGTIGTVSLATLLASPPFRTWISGPEMVECHYRADIPGSKLAVWFFVRLWAGGAVHVSAIVENGFLDNGAGAIAGNADAAYVPTVTIGGTVVYNNGGASLTHCRNTRWIKSGWTGTGADPQITPQHDTVYLQASKLVPNYPLTSPSSATLNALNSTYAPMSTGPIPPSMANPGDNPTIALLPNWDGLYLGSGGDARAYNTVMAGSSSLNSFGIVWRNATTKDIIKPSEFPTWSLDGPGGAGTKQVTLSNGAGWELNHHPGEGYLAYLLTGSYWHYETMLLQASAMWVMRSSTLYLPDGKSSTRNGLQRIVVNETRGTAWWLRSLAQTCALSPDGDPIAAEYKTLLANQYIYWRSIADDTGVNQLGYLYEYASSGLLNAYGSGWSPPWEQHWWMAVNGYASDMQPLADMSDLVAVRNWMYKGIVGILGPLSGFLYSAASVYACKISDGTSLDPNTWYDSWHDVAVGTFAFMPGGYASITDTGQILNGGDPKPDGTPEAFPAPGAGDAGHPSQATYGRWGYLLPAIAYAAEHGAPGAAAAWARITGASNYSTLTGAGFDQKPQWGIFPRAVAQDVSVAHVGPCIVMDAVSFLATGIVMDTNRGNGVPASSIPIGFGQPHPLLNDVDPSDPPNTQYAYEVTKVPPGLIRFEVQPNGAIIASGPDGTHVGEQISKKNGVRTIEPLTIQIGDPTPIVTSVDVSPISAVLAGAGVRAYSAVVNGRYSPSQTVTWSTTLGVINPVTGVLTAPDAIGVIQSGTVTATSAQDSSVSGIASFTVAAAGSTVTGVDVSPGVQFVLGGSTFSFNAVVLGNFSPSQNVTWATTLGSINPVTGAITAPDAGPTEQNGVVTATSSQNGAFSGTALFTVLAAPPMATDAARFARPVADVSIGAWIPSAGQALAPLLSEVTPDASNYIAANTTGSCEIALNPVADPGTSANQVVRYQAWASTGGSLTMNLMQGATVIASWYHATLPRVPTVFVQVLTQQQCDAITDYANLRFKPIAGA